MSHEVLTRDCERDFKLSELFFSTTDKRGVITAGNEVYVRVSGYSLDELVGSPHNIIRHPDMPRCAFKLLWSYLESGKRFAAYVKNRSKDGSYYWVLAAVFPIQDGYLSIRLKPSTPLRDKIAEVYADLLRLERSIELRGGNRKAAIEASTARLVEVIGSLGFASYDQLMNLLLMEELKSRAQQLGSGAAAEIPPGGAADASKERQRFLNSLGVTQNIKGNVHRAFLALDAYAELNGRLTTISASIASVAETLNFLSLNASVFAARLGEKGKTLGVIAERMASGSADVGKVIGCAKDDMASTQDILSATCFEVAVTQLVVESMENFLRELMTTPSGELATGGQEMTEYNLKTLGEVLSSGLTETERQILQLRSKLRVVSSGANDLTKLIRAIDFTHLTGRVEAARLEEAQIFLQIFDAASQLISSTREDLTRLLDQISSVQLPSLHSERLLHDMRRLLAAPA